MDIKVAIIYSLSIALFGLITFLFIKFKKPSQIVRPKLDQLTKLRQEHMALRGSIDIFRELSSRYFVTLNENGFLNLCNIETTLADTIDCCEGFLEKGRIEEVQQILSYAYVKRGLSIPPACLWASLGDRTSNLTDWSERSRELLLHIIESLNQSSTQLKDIGVAARRQRKSTTMMLSEVRAVLDRI